MKKLILGIAVFGLMTACNKETKVDESTTAATADSAIIDDSAVADVAAVPFEKIEWSQDETTKMLGKRNNDTLYVTNFFATWCGPCVREIPHFKSKMAEMKDQPVKFTFVSLDERAEWDKALPKFVAEHGLAPNVVMIDGAKLTPEFFPANFKEWDGGAIPFTFMRKGDQTDETLGMMSEEALTEKINSFK